MSLAPQIQEKTKKNNSNNYSRKPSWEEFASNTLIRSGRSVIPLTPFSWQSTLLEQIQQHSGIIIAKTRQLGATEFVASYLLWEAYMSPGYCAVIFSKNQDDSSDIAKRVRLMCSSHKDILLESENTKDLKLLNGGRLLFKPSTPNAARGIPSVSALFFDECAFVAGIEEIYGSALPSTEMLGSEAKIIVVSTPNGQQGFYWEQLSSGNGDRDVLDVCRDIRESIIPPVSYWTDKFNWCKFFVHWKTHPVYAARKDYLAATQARLKITKAQLEREYNLNFNEGIGVLFENELIKAAKKPYSLPIPPRPQHRYLAGVDPNFGGDDYFVCQVWDITQPPFTLVAMVRVNRKSMDYCISNSALLLKQYRPRMCGVESNAGGNLVAQEMSKLCPGVKIIPMVTTNNSKIVYTDRLILLHERGAIAYPEDSELPTEFNNFQEFQDGVTRTRKAASGHDDCVMAAAIAFGNMDIQQIPDAKVGVAYY